MSKFQLPEPTSDEDDGSDLAAEMLEIEQNRRRDLYAIDKGLFRLRKHLNLSQTEMGKLIGVSLRTYRFYEQGERSVPSEAIKELLVKTDCDLTELFTGQPMKFPPSMTEALLKHYDKVRDKLRANHPNLKQEEVRKLAHVYMAFSEPDEPVDLTKVQHVYDAMFKDD
ncbi:hypothetical protein BFP70_01295 [Thioclava sp. SK-1]|uniref:helix-turn-helix domain-containing protein n=1 Tax=Thioclava sp. SK-1 TaxID=1889770 RepID=UPI000826F79D|nr:helix-turn-helix transcriptional regulator [Thioclava sp. SK-1]OCX64180.1 hypothetical protein BFP70_01295 [Thioclava sp. SK-1]